MRRVLIVDDDEFYAGLVAKVFGQRRWLPVVCHNMEDALKEIDTMRVDLIVTDIFMPGIGGIEGIAFLKQQAPDVPVIAMSGGWDKLTPDEAVKAAVKVGARGGLAKPILADQLDALLKNLGLGGSDMGEPDWPQTANETTDWDEVFDAPVNGLIAWISNAATFDLLKISALNMVEHLFKNTRTNVDAKAYIERLTDILSHGHSGNQTQTLTAIVSLLNEIKAKFKQEDAHYVTKRKLERFNKRKSTRRKDTPKAAPQSPIKRYALPATAAILFLAFMTVMTVSGLQDEQAKPTVKPVKPVERTMNTRTKMGKTSVNKGADSVTRKLYTAPESKIEAETWKPPVQSFKPPKDAPPDMPSVLALSAIEWSPTPFTSRPEPVRMVPVLNVESFETMSIICDRAPKIMDMLNITLSAIPDDGDNPSSAELEKAALPVVGSINRFLSLELVKKVAFVSGPDMRKIKFINDPCRPLSPKELQDLNLYAPQDR